jgi:hypothetical protein
VSTSFSKATDLIAAGGASQEITTPGTEIGVRKLVLSSFAGNEQITLGNNNSTTLPIGIPRYTKAVCTFTTNANN